VVCFVIIDALAIVTFTTADGTPVQHCERADVRIYEFQFITIDDVSNTKS